MEQATEVKQNPSENVSRIVAQTLQEDVLREMTTLLKELSSKQEALLMKIEEQNTVVGDNDAAEKVHKTMLKTHQYYKKLLQIRKDMVEVHAKSMKLKDRAKNLLRIQEQNALHRQQKKLAQEQKEQRLIAKPVLKKK